jgi:aldehyde dehydrogenase (NAD+)
MPDTLAAITPLLQSLGLDSIHLHEGSLVVRTPIDGSVLARLNPDTPERVDAAIARAQAAFLQWRNTPAKSSPRDSVRCRK